MKALIQGIHSRNLGAMQMLLAARDQVRSWGGDAAVHWNWDAAARAKYGLDRVLWEEWTGRADAPVKMRLRMQAQWLRPPRTRPGTFQEPDVVLDASGFALSDQWGALKAGRHATNARRWSKLGARVVYLPQAFGPFTDPAVRDAAAVALSHADLVFARDPVSAAHLDDLGITHEPAPDFTCLLRGEPAAQHAGRPLVVPNARMVDRTADGDAYKARLAETVAHLDDPVVMVHEDGADRKLALDLVKGTDVPVVVETDPLRAKGRIAAASLLIGSRYHALVAALDQGVPAVGTSWSHKYDGLFDEFGCKDWLVPNMSAAAWSDALAAAGDGRDLAGPAHSRAEATRAVWQRVRALL